LLEAIREKLGAQRRVERDGWRAVFGRGDKKAVAEVQRVIDEEFPVADPEAWK
jgi:hypothetical protein